MSELMPMLLAGQDRIHAGLETQNAFLARIADGQEQLVKFFTDGGGPSSSKDDQPAPPKLDDLQVHKLCTQPPYRLQTPAVVATK